MPQFKEALQQIVTGKNNSSEISSTVEREAHSYTIAQMVDALRPTSLEYHNRLYFIDYNDYRSAKVNNTLHINVVDSSIDSSVVNQLATNYAEYSYHLGQSTPEMSSVSNLSEQLNDVFDALSTQPKQIQVEVEHTLYNENVITHNTLSYAAMELGASIVMAGAVKAWDIQQDIDASAARIDKLTAYYMPQPTILPSLRTNRVSSATAMETRQNLTFPSDFQEVQEYIKQVVRDTGLNEADLLKGALFAAQVLDTQKKTPKTPPIEQSSF